VEGKQLGGGTGLPSSGLGMELGMELGWDWCWGWSWGWSWDWGWGWSWDWGWRWSWGWGWSWSWSWRWSWDWGWRWRWSWGWDWGWAGAEAGPGPGLELGLGIELVLGLGWGWSWGWGWGWAGAGAGPHWVVLLSLRRLQKYPVYKINAIQRRLKPHDITAACKLPLKSQFGEIDSTSEQLRCNYSNRQQSRITSKQHQTFISRLATTTTTKSTCLANAAPVSRNACSIQGGQRAGPRSGSKPRQGWCPWNVPTGGYILTPISRPGLWAVYGLSSSGAKPAPCQVCSSCPSSPTAEMWPSLPMSHICPAVTPSSFPRSLQTPPALCTRGS